MIKRFDYSANRKEAVSEVTAYKMARMMQGTVDKGTAGGLRERLGAAEMGGKTGTTNSNADFWFMGYTPQLMAGGWVGCDDRFIRFSGHVGEGASAALPIWAYFFDKALADGTLGLDRAAKFSKPESMSNDEIFDYLNTINPDEAPAEGEDMGNGSSDDYIIPDMAPVDIKAESELSAEKIKSGAPSTEKPIVEAVVPKTEEKKEVKEEKRGGFLGLFRKKKKKEEEETQEPPKAVMPKKED